MLYENHAGVGISTNHKHLRFVDDVSELSTKIRKEVLLQANMLCIGEGNCIGESACVHML